MPSLLHAPHQTVHGWILERPLGSGGSCEVWRVHHPRLTGAFAMKILVSAEPVRAARFRREAAILQRALPEYPLQIYAHYAAAGPRDRPAFVLTAAEPFAVLVRRRALAEGALRAALAETALCLAGLHARGIAHGDVKPGNIVRAGGRWALTDFGLATIRGHGPPLAPGEIAGSRGFCAPELEAAGGPAGLDAPALDAFAFGRTLEAALGQDAPPPLRPLIERCLARAPAARPRLAEIARALAAPVPAPRRELPRAVNAVSGY